MSENITDLLRVRRGGGKTWENARPYQCLFPSKAPMNKHRTSAQMAYPNQEQQSWMHILRPSSKFQKLSHIHQ